MVLVERVEKVMEVKKVIKVEVYKDEPIQEIVPHTTHT